MDSADSILETVMCCILIQKSLKFVPKGPTGNKSLLVSDHGLLPPHQQAIVCGKHGLAYYVLLNFDEFGVCLTSETL